MLLSSPLLCLMTILWGAPTFSLVIQPQSNNSDVAISTITHCPGLNDTLTSKELCAERVIWSAFFHNGIHHVRSDALGLGSDSPWGHTLRLRSTQPVVLTEWRKVTGMGSWHRLTLTPFGGGRRLDLMYRSEPRAQVMFDLEVPQLPKEVLVEGTISWSERV